MSAELILGGARSGKSTYAERLARQSGRRVTVIATALPLDDEMAARIRAHREGRPPEWETVEALQEQGLIASNQKFPAATFWLTELGKQSAEKLHTA